MTKQFRLAAGYAVAVVLACAGKDDADKADSDGADAGARAVVNDTTPVPTAPAVADAPMAAVLTKLGSLGGKPIETLTAAEARRQPTPTDAVMALLKEQGKSTAPTALVPGVTSADRTIQAGGRSLPVTIYTPAGAGPFPVLVYYHGGGWVIGTRKVYDGGARGLSKAANAVVVSVDYRVGPENKFPASHDDAFATYEWAVANAASIKGNPAKVAVAGESAGGGLAVSTALMARDKKAQMPVAILAVYPIAGSDTTTPSYVQHAMAKPLNRAMMTWFFQQYLRSDADRKDPRINLVDADLKGLPPTIIINAQFDPLLSDGEMLARELRDAGVSVEQRTFDGVAHEFFGMGAVHPKAMEAQAMAGASLKKAFGM